MANDLFPEQNPFRDRNDTPNIVPTPASAQVPFGAPPRRRASAAARALTAMLIVLAVVCTGALAVVSGARLAAQLPAGDSSSAQGGASSGSSEEQHPLIENPDAPQLSLLPAGTEANALTETQIAAKVRPSVVGIVSYTMGTGSDGLPEAYSEGSGVVLTADGYILTNAHVVDYNYDISLLVVDYLGNRYSASVVGFDEKTDLAVIRVTDDAALLVPAEFGDSSTVQVGDPVLVIGNPGGLSYASSVTHGMVSAVNRVISTSVNVLGLFQVDAAINPGNSGGALVNQWGQVIGINCAKIAATDYEGIGFAIPMSKAAPIFNQLLRHGQVTNRVRLGITFGAVDDVTGSFKNLPRGMQITALDDSGVFARTDVREGDVIVAVNGASTADTAEFFEALYACAPNDKAEFTLFRPASGNQPGYNYTVTVALLPE